MNFPLILIPSTCGWPGSIWCWACSQFFRKNRPAPAGYGWGPAWPGPCSRPAFSGPLGCPPFRDSAHLLPGRPGGLFMAGPQPEGGLRIGCLSPPGQWPFPGAACHFFHGTRGLPADLIYDGISICPSLFSLPAPESGADPFRPGRVLGLPVRQARRSAPGGIRFPAGGHAGGTGLSWGGDRRMLLGVYGVGNHLAVERELSVFSHAFCPVHGGPPCAPLSLLFVQGLCLGTFLPLAVIVGVVFISKVVNL